MKKLSKCCTCGYEWKTGTNGDHSCIEILQKTIEKTIKLAIDFNGIDGTHHKDWVIDQMVRILSGGNYETLIKNVCNGEDGQNTYFWDCGIAP
jgi:hypothetical protein